MGEIITTFKILNFLESKWYNFYEIVNKFDIEELNDIRYLEIKLKYLEDQNELISFYFGDHQFWKVPESSNEYINFLEFLYRRFKDNIFIFFELGTQFYYNSDYENAAKYFDKVLSIDPFDVESWAYLALCSMESEDYVLSIKFFENASECIDLYNRSWAFLDVYQILGYCHMMVNNYKEAIENFKNSIKLREHYFRIKINDYIFLVKSFLRINDLENALNYLERAYEINPNDEKVETLINDVENYIEKQKNYKEKKRKSKDINVKILQGIDRRLASIENYFLHSGLLEIKNEITEINERTLQIKNNQDQIILDTSKIDIIIDQLTSLDELELFLREKLTSDWEKLKQEFAKLKKGKISRGEFIKKGLKIVGKKFLKILGNKVV